MEFENKVKRRICGSEMKELGRIHKLYQAYTHCKL
jgi:hypothetical protein